MDLRGVRILITRPKEQAGELARLIEAAGGSALCAPMIRIIAPETWDACDAEIARLREYSGIVFTSVNGVEWFLRRLAARGHGPAEIGRPVAYAIGDRTAQALQQAGIQPVFVPATFSAAGLASHFAGRELKGDRYLLPRGNLGKDEVAVSLRGAGATVVPIVVYRTVGPDDQARAFVRSAIASRSVDVATFMSPSAVEHFVKLLDGNLLDVARKSLIVAAIGEPTAEAVRKGGLSQPIVAGTATSQGIIEALMSWENSAQAGR